VKWGDADLNMKFPPKAKEEKKAEAVAAA